MTITERLEALYGRHITHHGPRCTCGNTLLELVEEVRELTGTVEVLVGENAALTARLLALTPAAVTLEVH